MTVAKIANSEVDNDFKALAESAIAQIKSTYKGAKVKREKKEVKAFELPKSKTWLIRSLLVFKVEAKDADTVYIELEQLKKVDGSDIYYKSFCAMSPSALKDENYEDWKVWESAVKGGTHDKKQLLHNLGVNLVEVASRRKYKLDTKNPEIEGKSLLNTAQKFLDDLRFPNQDGADKESELSRNGVSRSFRNWDYFRGRSGVEDDDEPDFTGRDEATKYVKSRMPKELEKLNLDLYEQEKAWFTVQFNLKN